MLDVIKTVGRHYFVYGLGNVFNRMLSFLLIPFYTNYLTTSDYGTLELVELSGYFAGMFMAMGVSNAVLRFYYDSDDPEDRRRIVSTAHVSVWGIAVAMGIGLVALSPNISGLVFHSTDNRNLFRLAFISLALTVCAEVPLNYLRAQQKSVLFTIISVARLLMGLGLNILFLVGMKWGVEGILVSTLLSQIAATLILSAYTFRKTGFRVSWPDLRAMTSYGLPYIASGLSVFVLHLSDRFFLERYSTLSVVGIYALGSKFAMAVSPLLTEPFLAVWRPKAFEIAHQKDAKETYSNVFTYYCFLGMFLVLAISTFTQDLIPFMSPPEFHASRLVVPMVALSYLMWGGSLLMQLGVLLAKKTRHIAWVGAVAAGLKLILAPLLIPPLGMWGAAWATLASCTLLFCLQYWIEHRYLVIPYQWSRLVKLLVAAGLGYAVSVIWDPESLILGLALKTLLVLSFPVLLAAFGFYTEPERRRIRELAKWGLRRFRPL